MAGDYGSDVSTFPDLDPTFTPISGRRAIAEAVARGLVMPHGQLLAIGDRPDCGYDLRSQLSARMTPDKEQRIKTAVEAEALRDERVLAVTVSATYDAAARTLRVQLFLETSIGPFAMVLAVGEVTADLLVE